MGELSSIDPKRAQQLSYLMGLLTATFMFLTILIFVGYRIGFDALLEGSIELFLPAEPYHSVLELPGDVLDELKGYKAVIGNAGNPTEVPRHNTLLVQPDDELTYSLRPDTHLSVYMLRSTKPFNIDPPNLVMREDIDISPVLEGYIRDQSRLSYAYSTNEDGHRNTVPDVKSEDKVLIIGDSVAFGIGVNDEKTIASQLQQKLGNSVRVINAGIGGYSGQQAYLMARRLSEHGSFSGLIYIACQNDFMHADDWVAEADNVLSKIAAIADRFNNNVIVFLETYMEYTIRDVFLDKGWAREELERTAVLRKGIKDISLEKGFHFIDWAVMVEEYQQREMSIFSRLGLYADHVHLSPMGSLIVANRVYDTYMKQESPLPH